MSASTISVIHKISILRQLSEHGDFKSAAASLSITPSALTQSIKSLEGHFEQTLIVREKGQVSLTPEGETLIEKFSPVLNQIEALDREYSEGGALAKLRLGAYDSLAVRYLPNLYNNISKRHSDIKIDLQVGRSAELVTQIHRGYLDMALVVDPPESDSYYRSIIAHNTLSLYTHKKNIEKDLKKMSFGCLRTESDGRQSFISKVLNEISIKSKDINIQTDSLETLLALCCSGEIVAILPSDLAERHEDELVEVAGRFTDKDLKELTRHPLAIISRTNFPGKWRDEIEQVLKELSF